VRENMPINERERAREREGERERDDDDGEDGGAMVSHKACNAMMYG
jgi:hypothetical protein